LGPSTVPSAPSKRGVGCTYAILLNGGSSPEANFQSHLHHLEDMVARLEARGIPRERIAVFSADGQDPAADLATRTPLPAGFWLIEDLPVGNQLRPRQELTDTRWPGITLRPATHAALREWFESSGRALLPSDQLLLFVTDHGTGNREEPDNGAISLWNEALTVKELRALLDLLPDGVRTALVMSQCYSGTFARAMYDGDEPSGDVCGFFSTARDLKAYGCYPEGRDRDRIGHAFTFIESLGRQPTLRGAHRDVLVLDDTPDAPLQTTDAYLADRVVQEAKAKKETLAMAADRLLRQAWMDRAAWEPEIRLLDRIGEAFGTFSPRTLEEVGSHDDDLAGMADRLRNYGRRWDQALRAVKSENLADFLGSHGDWKERLDGQATLDADGRRQCLAELLPLLEQHARSRPEIWERLERLRVKSHRTSNAEWRLDVRRAALRRARSILLGIAGRTLLAGGGEPNGEPAAITAARGALERLDRCESFDPGGIPTDVEVAAAVPSSRFPPLAAERALLEEVLPSWLGVRFGSVPESMRAGRDLPSGATLLELVYPDTPASEGGFHEGDIVLGPAGRRFDTREQLREWTMTSPVGKPLALAVVRPGVSPAEDETLQITVTLTSFPDELPGLPGPPQVGEAAPPLPATLQSVGPEPLGPLTGRSHLLFFWATWCVPCKAAVPEVLAFSQARGIPAVAITDEEPAVVSRFLAGRKEPFFAQVAIDTRRRSLIDYGVSGTPTIVLVDADGKVQSLQVGYDRKKGIAIEGWRWMRP
jgi:thiol-disulfide isomerase/thioredoxin